MSKTRLQFIVILTGLLNSFAYVIYNSMMGENNDLVSLLGNAFGMTYLIPLAVLVAYLIVKKEASCLAKRKDVLIAIIALGLFIIPSSLLSAIVLSLYCFFYLWTATNTNQKAAWSILLFASLKIPVLAILYKTVEFYIFNFDATLASHVSHAISGYGYAVGNLIYGQGEHMVIVIRACMALDNMYLTGLTAWALLRFWYPKWQITDWFYIGGLAIAVYLSNVIRIGLMALTPELYEIIHAGYGKQLYDIVLVLITLGFLLLARRSYAQQNSVNASRDHTSHAQC